MTGRDTSEALDDATTVLMVAPDVRDAPVSACAGLASNGGAPLDRVVGVTVGQSPSDWLGAWERQQPSPTPAVTCVDVESVTRSAAARTSAAPSGASLRTVRDAADLQSLGETLAELLADADAADERAAVCLHSLTDLLGHVSQERAFAFLCTLDDRARRYGAVVYVHLDAAAHDEATVEVFSAVSDAVVEFGDGVEMVIR